MCSRLQGDNLNEKVSMKRDFSLTFKNFFTQYSIASFLVVIIIILCLVDTTLVSVRNFRNIASDAAPLVLMSIGMALCLYSGQVDLSAGAVAAFSGIIAGSFVQKADIAGRIITFLPTLPAFIIIPLVISLFYAIGMFYGTFLHKFKIPSWFFTLALSSIMMGLGYMYVSISEIGSMQITGFSNQYLQFGVGYIGTGPTYSLPFTVLVSIVILVGLWFFLKTNKLELRNATMTLEKRSSKKNLQTIYACALALFSLAGIMISARNGVSTPAIGFGLTSDALAVCLIAGFSLSGKLGKFSATIIVTIIYVALIYCITFIGVNEYISMVIRGILLVGAYILEMYIQQKESIPTDK